MRESVSIRSAALFDAKRLLEIYAYYVRETAVSFEYDVPSLAEFEARMRNILKNYPYLVIESCGEVVGYAYAGPFVGRQAYDRSCELSIYLDRSACKHGLGRRLYEAMEAELKKRGFLNLYACIAYPKVEDEFLTRNSADFHAHMGFSEVGRFHKCGHKFGRWYDMIWMERVIGDHTGDGIENPTKVDL